MAFIKPKKKQPFKIQFYVDEDLENLYKENKEIAKKIGVGIDFKEDFKKWFFKENKKINDELKKLQKYNGKNN